MQRKSLSISLVALASLLVGCEWTSSSGGSSSWSDSYDAMNFAGTYRVVSASQTGTTDNESSDSSGSGQSVQTKFFGTTTAGVYTYSGTVGLELVEGSVSILFGTIGGFIPNGTSQELTSKNINGSATVNYQTGHWDVNLESNPGSDIPIRVEYQTKATGQNGVTYTTVDTSSFDKSKLTAITVSQTGQYLTMAFNNGVSMSGRFTSVRQTGQINEDTGAGANTYNAQFEVSGANSKFVGTLNYDYPSHNRYLDGSWTYGRGVFDIHAVGPAWTESGATTANEVSSSK